MNDKELSNWFWNKFYSCYTVRIPGLVDKIFLCYDPIFIRYKKLNRITSNKEIIFPSKVSGKIIFEFDITNKYFWCSFDILSYLKKNYSTSSKEIRDLIAKFFSDYEQRLIRIRKNNIDKQNIKLFKDQDENFYYYIIKPTEFITLPDDFDDYKIDDFEIDKDLMNIMYKNY